MKKIAKFLACAAVALFIASCGSPVESAKKAIEKNIKTNPNIICVKHTSTISSSARKRGFDTKVLNDVANKISNEVRESLVKSPKR